MPEPKGVYNLRLKANSEVFANLVTEAPNIHEAVTIAIEKAKNGDIKWQFDTWESLPDENSIEIIR